MTPLQNRSPSLRTIVTAIVTAALVSGLLAQRSAAGVAQQSEAEPAVYSMTSSDVVPLHDVFELTLFHAGEYANPFLGVELKVTLHSPGGKLLTVGGFYYGRGANGSRGVEKPKGDKTKGDKTKEGIWKARFVPQEEGSWKYTYTFAPSKGPAAIGQGGFSCVRGRRETHGFLRQHSTNPHRWVFDDGAPYFPIGLQECVADHSKTGSVLDTASLEGPFRTDRTDLVELPPGPLYVRGPSWNPQNADVYFRRYARCGFNLFRFSQKNCSYDLYKELDQYLLPEAVLTDDLLLHVRKYGFRVMYGLFGFREAFNNAPDNAEGMARVKRFIKYSVDRWGAYVDFWELLNEQKADDRWYAQLVPYLRSVDPYNHPITTSWERPQLEGIEINAPHWYGNEDEHESDRATASRAARWKRHGKPVIVGEQGNAAPRGKARALGVGGVWDAGSARRMRLRIWTAFFQEISFIFWNTSYARDGHYMNIWLGPREREYVRALQDFAYRLDADVRMVPVGVSKPRQARGYALASGRQAAVYLHHYADHGEALRDLEVTLYIPQEATAYWYSPGDASIVGQMRVPRGKAQLEVPSFVVDLALLVTAQGPPDIDGDGMENSVDKDDDNDGIPDKSDAFPLEPEEWEDRDGDLIGDRLDADRDGDGKGDDRNGNGVADHEEMDFDGDGVPRSRAVPWDAFPLDPLEWRDTDGDGTGDNADADDDGDGWSDDEEKKAGTDPLNRLRFPVTARNEKR